MDFVSKKCRLEDNGPFYTIYMHMLSDKRIPVCTLFLISRIGLTTT